MRFLSLAAALIALLPASAYAQSAVLQAGPVTPGHVPMYAQGTSNQTVVQDSGTADGGAPNANPKELGLTVRGSGAPPYANAGTGPLSTNFCDYDSPTTSSTGYHYLCMSPNAQGGGIIAYGHSPTASALPFSLSVNGTAYQFPFSTSGIVGPGTTVVGDLVTWANTVGTLVADTAHLALGQLPQIAADTVLCNATASSATPTACTSLPFSVFGDEPANEVFAGPASGSATTPAFRSLVGADLPEPGASSLGGVQSFAGAAHQFLTSISTSGVVSAAQPAYTDLSGTTNAVTNTALAQAPADTFKGNNTGSTANVTDMTAAQATAILPTFTGDSGSGGVKGLVPAPSAGDAAAGKVLGAGGAWVSHGLGINQSWTSESRSVGTTYQNTSGNPIEVKVNFSLGSSQNAFLFTGSASPSLEVDDIGSGGGAASNATLSAIIPPNWYYEVTVTGTPTLSFWVELR